MLKRLWANLNWRYCKTNQYLAQQRHDTIEAIRWSDMAWRWSREWN
jgi:putative IMPACT (imprinted ancient) family translation regulator